MTVDELPSFDLAEILRVEKHYPILKIFLRDGRIFDVLYTRFKYETKQTGAACERITVLEIDGPTVSDFDYSI